MDTWGPTKLIANEWKLPLCFLSWKFPVNSEQTHFCHSYLNEYKGEKRVKHVFSEYLKIFRSQWKIKMLAKIAKSQRRQKKDTKTINSTWKKCQVSFIIKFFFIGFIHYYYNLIGEASFLVSCDTLQLGVIKTSFPMVHSPILSSPKVMYHLNHI